MKELALVLVGLLFASLVFFSRGILISLTIACLALTQSPFQMIHKLGLILRWVFFSLFTFHVFGDIFLGRTVRRVKTFDIFALVFIIYAFFSTFYSPLPVLTLERATTVLVLYISVFWIIWKYTYDQSPEKVVYLILKVTMLLFIASYLLIITPYRTFLAGRFQGIFQNPNSIGITCAILIPLALWEFIETRRKTALFLFFMMLIALFISASRNAINATVISMGYFVFWRTVRRRPVLLFFLIALIFIAIWAINSIGTTLFREYIRAKSLSTMGGRSSIWPFAWDLFLKEPFFGYGFGIEEKIFPLKYFIFRKVVTPQLHNSYLGMLIQLGILGFIVFFTPLFTLLFKELFSKKEGSIPLLRYALRASLIAGLMCAIFETWIYSVGNAQAFPFWIIVMLLVFYRYQERKEVVMPEGT